MTSSPKAPSWIRTLHPSPTRRPAVLCFPHGGGTASAYRALSEALAPTVELLVVQYPGRQDRLMDPMVDDLAEIAALVVKELPPDRRKIGVFGHSMGATIAFEAARLLDQPTALFVSGRPAPQHPETAQLHRADDATLIADLRRLGGPDSAAADLLAANPDLAELVLPFVRNDYKAVETYRVQPGPPLRCPVVALVADSDPTVTRSEAEGWREHTTGEFELETFTGGHFYLDDHLPRVTEIITTRLAN